MITSYHIIAMFMLPPPYSGALGNDDRRLSVRLSVCPMPDTKSRTERRMLKIGRRKVHDTGNQ